MASLSLGSDKLARIIIKRPNGKRYPIRLGQMGKRRAETIRGHIHELEQSVLRGISVPPETRQWADATTGDFRAKLAAAGLVEAKSAETVGGLVEAVKAWKKPQVKPPTLVRAELAYGEMIREWGADRRLDSLTLGDGDDLVAAMKARGLAHATTHKRMTDCRAALEWAVRRRLLAFNPLEGVRLPSTPDASRRRYIDTETAEMVMQELPTPELRLVLAMARWGGLRIPSELQRMEWGHINRETRRIRVLSPKTEHHPGHESRIVPLFIEIEGPLSEAYEAAEEGERYVFPYARSVSPMMLRKKLMQAIESAGLEAWPKPWHNMRSTRQTELEDRLPTHVVCAILGNTEKVASRHYLQVTERHFDDALKSGAQSGAHQPSKVEK